MAPTTATKALTVTQLAEWLRGQMTTDTRDDGKTLVKFADSLDCGPDSPHHWVFDLIHDAHGTLLPDDAIYEAVRDALDIIAEHWEPGTDAGDLTEHVEADVYTHDLLAWMSSHLDRYGRVEEALRENGVGDGGLTSAIQWAQVEERVEVLSSVLQSLEARVEELADDD